MTRVRFSGFLLLVTLASVIAAAFAIRARTTYLESVQEQGFRADQARRAVNWWEDRIKDGMRKIARSPSISKAWADGCDLRLMPSATDPAEIPTEGKDLIVVANYYGVLYFRMFDRDGKIVVDHAEGEGTHPRIKAFKKQLVSLGPPYALTGIEKGRVITSAMYFIHDYRTSLQDGVKIMEAGRAAAIAKAEHHERLARRP